MAVHLLDDDVPGLPGECELLSEVTIGLLDQSDRPYFDELLATRHYLKNATAVGQVLRYVVKHRDRWVALLVFNSAAFHLKPREQWLQWSARQLEERRHLLAQNSRFLILASPGKWPNLASRILKLVCAGLAEDWRHHFGHPVLAVETFVDPQRFRATCYKAAGWQLLGPTQGHERSWQDFYTDTEHPKELWVRTLAPGALEQLRAEQLPWELVEYQRPVPPACPVATARLASLWERFVRLEDPRKARGKRYVLASVLTIIALAVAAGCKGPHAIADFAQGLNHGQRRLLRCRARKGQPRQLDVPCERTFRRLLKTVDPNGLKEVLVQWMEAEDPEDLKVLHLDGKVLKNAHPAPAEAPAGEAPPISEIPSEQQKPKADKALTLVNFLTSKQRLVDQIAVPQNTNEEAAVARHLSQMSLEGVCVTADAAHLVKANCRQITQQSQGDYLLTLKANQPHALAKAEQAFTGDFPPSGRLD